MAQPPGRNLLGNKHMPPVEPKRAAERLIDESHLARQTLNDASLRDEVMALFHGQLADIEVKLKTAKGVERAAIAHRLSGAARGVGAFPLAAAARTVEEAPGSEQGARQLDSEIAAMLVFLRTTNADGA